jgi:hypothetical protein
MGNKKVKATTIIAEFPLSKEPVDYQLTVHLQNMKAYYGEKRIKQFLKDFYFGNEIKKVSNG